jgi:hypothetical protein
VDFEATWLSPEATLQRDLTILRTLVYLGWSTTEHMHALCFPCVGIATARMALRTLEDAGWIWHARWRIKTSSGSHIWTITTKGLQLLTCYGFRTTRSMQCSLGRPSTAFEHVEWRVGLAARTLITRLVLEARRTELLAHYNAVLSTPWRGSPVDDGAPLPPDVVLSIAWAPRIRHPSTWLPWITDVDHDVHTNMVQYALSFDRASWSHVQKSEHIMQSFVIAVATFGREQRDSVSTLPPNENHKYVWPFTEQSIGQVLQQLPISHST